MALAAFSWILSRSSEAQAKLYPGSRCRPASVHKISVQISILRVFRLSSPSTAREVSCVPSRGLLCRMATWINSLTRSWTAPSLSRSRSTASSSTVEPATPVDFVLDRAALPSRNVKGLGISTETTPVKAETSAVRQSDKSGLHAHRTSSSITVCSRPAHRLASVLRTMRAQHCLLPSVPSRPTTVRVSTCRPRFRLHSDPTSVVRPPCQRSRSLPSQTTRAKRAICRLRRLIAVVARSRRRLHPARPAHHAASPHHLHVVHPVAATRRQLTTCRPLPSTAPLRPTRSRNACR